MSALFLMIGLAIFFALRGLLGNNKLFEFPTVAALLYLAFFVPQALAVQRDSILVGYDPWILWLYMAICLLMIAAGFAIGKRYAVGRAAKTPAPPIDTKRIVMGAVFLAVIGFLAIRQVNSMSSAANALGSSWTGEITAWYLLMQAIFYAFALGCVGYLRLNKNKVLLVVAFVTLVAITFMVSGNVKRHMIAELLIILAGTWFFVKHKQPPKVLTVVGCLLGMVILHQVGSIRQYMSDGRGSAIEAVLDGVPFQEFSYFTQDDAPEVAQAVVDIYAVNQTGNFEGPASLWNKMIHQFVPAFIVGRQLKESLKVETNISVEQNYRLDNFERQGATRTGFSDTYRSYGPLGALVFMLLGMFMGWLYGMAIQGRIWAQFYYVILLNDGLIAMTEATDRFIVSLPIVFGLTMFFVLPRAQFSKNVESKSFRRRKQHLKSFRPNRRRSAHSGAG